MVDGQWSMRQRRHTIHQDQIEHTLPIKVSSFCGFHQPSSIYHFSQIPPQETCQAQAKLILSGQFCRNSGFRRQNSE
jgi:hypothetical protein